MRVERWELVIDGLPTALRQQAQQNGCGNLRLVSYYGISEKCREHVLKDHDLWYQSAYMDAVTSAIDEDQWGYCDEPVMCAFAGSNGVFVLSKEKPNGVTGSELNSEHFIVTAYRVSPRGVKPLLASQQDFLKSAVRKLRDKTSFHKERDI
jgi:hypothetical protein